MTTPGTTPNTPERSAVARWRRRPSIAALTSGQGLVGVVLLVSIMGAGLLAPILATADPLSQPPRRQLAQDVCHAPVGD